MHEKKTVAVVVLLALSTMGGQARALADGVEIGATYTQDYFRDVAGGAARGGGAPGTIDLTTTVDGRAWGGTVNDRIHADLLQTVGSSISRQAGDLQGLDNIEADDTTRLFEAWYQHDFQGTGYAVRLGLQDYNALFDVLDAAGVFINSSFGLDPTISQLPVSTFPVTAVGAVARWQASDGAYVMAGAYDGKPGLEGHPNGTHIEFRSGDGLFNALEAGLVRRGAHPYKVALGGWYRTSDFEDPMGRDRNANHGMYAIAQRRLTPAGAMPALDAFVQLGATQSDRNVIDRYLGAGMTATGPFPRRPDDVLGIAVAQARTADGYRRQTPNSSDAETTVELTYQVPVNDHVSVQPDVQYIINPGASTAVDDAWALGVRGQITW